MSVIRVIRYGFLVGWQEFAGIWGWKTWVSGWMVNVMAQVAFFALMGELLRTPDFFRYLLIGNAVVVGCFHVNVATSATAWDRGDGTYSLLVVAPSSLLPAVMGRTSVWLMDGAATSSIALVLVQLIFGIGASWMELALAPFIILVSCASSFSLAMVLGGIVARVPRARNIVHRMLTTTLMTICGVNVPVSFWPESIQMLASILPITHGLRGVRMLIDGAPAADILQQVALEALVGVAWLTVSLFTLDRMAEGGRRDGSIEFV